jgi:hypothetical protein
MQRRRQPKPHLGSPRLALLRPRKANTGQQFDQDIRDGCGVSRATVQKSRAHRVLLLAIHPTMSRALDAKVSSLTGGILAPCPK